MICMVLIHYLKNDCMLFQDVCRYAAPEIYQLYEFVMSFPRKKSLQWKKLYLNFNSLKDLETIRQNAELNPNIHFQYDYSSSKSV
jgi:hypothetical protein